MPASLARCMPLCLCLAALFAATACQSSAGPVVTSVSGCVDVGTMTVNCTLPVLLTVRGSGFLTNVTGAAPLYTSSPSYWITPLLELSPEAVATGEPYPYSVASALFPANDTYFVFEVNYLGRGVLVEGVPLELTVIAGKGTTLRQSMSAPFVAVSLLSLPPPVVSSVSGCPIVGADGLSVTQCLPDVHLLTLTGTGFLQWRSTPLSLNAGNVQTSLNLRLANVSSPSFTPDYTWILNDTVITITLATAYRYLLQAGDFGAPPRALFIQERLSGWQSRPMTIQFAALPPPSNIWVAPYVFYNLPGLPGCVRGPNSTILNCTAGSSMIAVRGTYLYEVTVTIGGQPMTNTFNHLLQSDASVLYLVTPLYNFQPGLLYDIVLTSASGSITLPSYVSFSGQPTIVSAACRDPLLAVDIASLACQAGETVTMNGPYLPPPTTPFTVTVYSLHSKQNVTCSSPRYNTAYQLACDMLATGLPATGGWDTWSAGCGSGCVQRHCLSAPRSAAATTTASHTSLHRPPDAHCSPLCCAVPLPQVPAVGQRAQPHPARPL